MAVVFIARTQQHSQWPSQRRGIFKLHKRKYTEAYWLDNALVHLQNSAQHLWPGARVFILVIIGETLEMFLLRFPNYFQFSKSNRWSLFISYFMKILWFLTAVITSYCWRYFPPWVFIVTHYHVFSLPYCLLIVYSTFLSIGCSSLGVYHWLSSLFHINTFILKLSTHKTQLSPLPPIWWWFLKWHFIL